MSGDLDMDSHFIKNVGINLSDDTTVVPKSYVDSFANTAVLNPLTTDLVMNNFQIKQLKTPTEDKDAINKKYFEDELLKSHLIPSHRENAFKYFLDQDERSSERNIIVNGIVDFNGSPHKNKKAYSVIFTKDSDGSHDYRSRIGINIFPLDVGSYTIIMEYYWPENTNIQLTCQATTAWVRKQTSKDFSSYTKILVQFNQTSKDTPDYLFFNIHGRAMVSNPQGYLIFYGLKGWADSVPSQIYDSAIEASMFEFDNGKMAMNTDIDLNGYSVINARQEEYFRIKVYYKSSVRDNIVLFGNNAFFTKVLFSGYLIEVDVLITSDAVGYDHKFMLQIRGHDLPTNNILLTTTDNSKYQRFIDFKKNLFVANKNNFWVRISHDSHATTRPIFTEVNFYFKCFRI